MLSHINKLHELANKPTRQIIGLMSGTSLDGLDIALCKVTGSGADTQIQVEEFTTVSYEADFRNEVRKVFSIPEGNIELVVLLHAYIGNMHGKMILDALHLWGKDAQDIDLIASHGQTIYHAPKSLHQIEKYGNATLQIGDGDHIAMTTGIITLCDFRMKHIAAGGEGAPLAVYADYLIFSDAYENRIMLNIGGIANYTWLPNAVLRDSSPCFSTDVGPGNTMLDAYVQRHFPHMSCDVDGAIARSGVVNDHVLAHLMDNAFYHQEIPKTIGPELFNLAFFDHAKHKANVILTHEDALATLNKFSAMMIVDCIKKHLPLNAPYTIFASGGGIHNPTLMQHISTILYNVQIKPLAKLGIQPDAKEAVLFALLANECVTGTGMGLVKSLNGMPDVSMGKVCFPG
jgi:anhydro-N-acetylmuramic acid kinase